MSFPYPFPLNSIRKKFWKLVRIIGRAGLLSLLPPAFTFAWHSKINDISYIHPNSLITPISFSSKTLRKPICLSRAPALQHPFTRLHLLCLLPGILVLSMFKWKQEKLKTYICSNYLLKQEASTLQHFFIFHNQNNQSI